jgi:AAA ATPase containing von Willebrand factor type A (vWA) domain
LALRALVDVLEKFSGGVRRVARELERTAAVVGGGEPGSGDGDGVVLEQFADDEDDEEGEDGPIKERGEEEKKAEEKKAEENVEAEAAKTEIEAAKTEIEAITDEGGGKERVVGGSSDGGDENDDKSNVDESSAKKSSSATDRSNRGHHRREGDSLWMEQVLLPAVDHFWRAGPTARMDLLSLKAKQSRRKVELMERAGLSESEADGVAAKTVAGEAGEAAAAAVAAATAALGDGGDASNKTLQDASNDAGGGVPAAPKIVADAQAPAHPILASAAVAQISAALASATAKPSGGGGDAPPPPSLFF